MRPLTVAAFAALAACSSTGHPVAVTASSVTAAPSTTLDDGRLAVLSNRPPVRKPRATTTSTTSTTTTLPPTPPPPDYHAFADWPVWHAIGRCEQPARRGEPDTHGDGIAWAHRGSYNGGLGVLNINWAAYGGLAYAPRADLAPPAAQIAVARNIRARHGLRGPWTCARRLGLGP